MPVPTSPQDLIDLIREKLFNNTSGLIEEPDLREVLENIVKVLDAKFSMFSPNLTEEQYAQWNLILDYMAKETKGVLSPTSPAPTEKGKYLLSSAGTYTNLGGLVATADKLNYGYFDGTTWSKVEVAVPKGEDGKTIESWSAKPFAVGSQVFYNGEIYEAKEAASSTNLPSENSLIWKKVLSDNIIYSEADFEISDEKSKSIVKFLDGHVKTKNFDSRNINLSSTRDLKILFIGNSFSRDAVMYLPAHLKDIAPEINLSVGIAYLGGCTLGGHYVYGQNNDKIYSYDRSVGGDKWTLVGGKSLQEIVIADDWDIISFQQQSAASRDYATYQPYLNDLVNLVFGLRKNVRLAWLFTPPLPTGGIGMPSGMTSNQFFQDMTVAVSKVMNETAIDLLFPCGTAIQNARTTALNNLGVFGQMSYDGLHLNDGIACQIATYAIVEKICKIMGISRSIVGNNITVDENFLVQNDIKEINEGAVGSTAENRLIAQKAAIMAIKKPFEITNINF